MPDMTATAIATVSVQPTTSTPGNAAPLGFTLSASDTQLDTNQRIILTAQITNNSGVNATDLTFTVNMPLQIRVTNVTTSANAAPVVDNNLVTLRVNSLAAGAAITVVMMGYTDLNSGSIQVVVEGVTTALINGQQVQANAFSPTITITHGSGAPLPGTGFAVNSASFAIFALTAILFMLVRIGWRVQRARRRAAGFDDYVIGFDDFDN